MQILNRVFIYRNKKCKVIEHASGFVQNNKVTYWVCYLNEPENEFVVSEKVIKERLK